MKKDQDDPFGKKKKKKLPFYGKVGGRTSRRRADRKAGGGAVRKLQGGGPAIGTDPTPLVGALAPPGPMGGGLGPGGEAVNMTPMAGGGTGNSNFDSTFGGIGPASQEQRQRRAQAMSGMKKGGAVKRAEGGPTGEEERSAGLKKLSSVMKAETSKSPGEARPFDNPRTSASNISRYVRPGLSEERGGFKKGGKVKKRAVGGETDCPPGGAPMPGTGPGAGGYFPASAPGGAMGNAIAGALMGPGGGIANFRPMKKGGGVKKRAVGGDAPVPGPLGPGGDVGAGSSLPAAAPPAGPPPPPIALPPVVRGGGTGLGAPADPDQLRLGRAASASDLALSAAADRKRGGVVGKKDGGKLSASQRQSLPKSDFALPGKGAGPKGAGSGSYPIPDESHARNALARSSGKPVAAQVRAKVKAKYPDIG